MNSTTVKTLPRISVVDASGHINVRREAVWLDDVLALIPAPLPQMMAVREVTTLEIDKSYVDVTRLCVNQVRADFYHAFGISANVIRIEAHCSPVGPTWR